MEQSSTPFTSIFKHTISDTPLQNILNGSQIKLYIYKYLLKIASFQAIEHSVILSLHITPCDVQGGVWNIRKLF